MQPRQPSSKASVQALHSLEQTQDTTGTAQGARRATEAVPVVSDHHASTEVVARTKRRFKSNTEKRRIVSLADACTLPGEVGLLLRREGIYSSNLSNWRQQLRAADQAALEVKKRGPKPNLELAQARRVETLTREKLNLQKQLDRALLIIEVQKKVSMLIGLTLDTPPEEST
jgi:transposase